MSREYFRYLFAALISRHALAIAIEFQVTEARRGGM
jgi:hypothetical protein